jgi:murein DD-endopeptidase MepM/ murein hydrolase activator NlpD
MATLGYAKQKWHLPSRLPADGQYTAALIPADSPATRLQLAYLELDYHGRQERVYHYVDSQGHDLILGKRGEGYRILDPLLPVFDARISSGWGWRTQPVLGGDEFHQGVDYAAPMGTPVHATMDGVVKLSEWRANYGRLVEIKHPGNLSTRYAHLSAYATHIRRGSPVHRGQIIGYVGSSGLSTGPHLYYEVWDHGTRINPQSHQQLWVTASLDARERRRFGAYIGRMAAP